MKLQMKREALIKLNRQANEQNIGFDTSQLMEFWNSFSGVRAEKGPRSVVLLVEVV